MIWKYSANSFYNSGFQLSYDKRQFEYVKISDVQIPLDDNVVAENRPCSKGTLLILDISTVIYIFM
jgi:hypothetical protein